MCVIVIEVSYNGPIIIVLCLLPYFFPFVQWCIFFYFSSFFAPVFFPLCFLCLYPYFWVFLFCFCFFQICGVFPPRTWVFTPTLSYSINITFWLSFISFWKQCIPCVYRSHFGFSSYIGSWDVERVCLKKVDWNFNSRNVYKVLSSWHENKFSIKKIP